MKKRRGKLSNAGGVDVRQDFKILRQAIDLALGVISKDGVTVTQLKGLRPRVIQIALGQFCKIIKLCQAVEAVCARKLHSEADILARSVFESRLALEFLLRHRITLRGLPKQLFPAGRPALPTKLRTALFLAHQAFQDAKQVRELRSGMGTKRMVNKRQAEAAFRIEEHWKQEIGPQWTEVLKRGSYSGLNIIDLCRSLGRVALQRYGFFYRYASKAAHGADSVNHMALHEDGKTLILKLDSTPRELAAPLSAATILLLESTSILNGRFGLGIKSKIDELARELKSSRQRR